METRMMESPSALNKLLGDEWKHTNQLVLFGFGRHGKKMYELLKKDFRVKAIIDMDKKKQGKQIDGLVVQSMNEADRLLKENKIIVTTNAHNYRDIRKILENMGLKEYDDFVMSQQFIIEYYYKFKRKIYTNITIVPITSVCTLNCENCQLYIPYWRKRYHRDLAEIEEDIDCYFRYVDYVSSIDVLGGEPFLHPQIDEILEHIGKYREKIGIYGMTTNGTVKIKESTLNILQKYDMYVAISDYTRQVDYEERLKSVCESLDQYGIQYQRNTDIEWYDFGFPKNRYYYTVPQARTHMKICNTMCHALAEKKFFYCINTWAAYRSGLFLEDRKGYIDLATLNPENVDDKREILEYCLGNVKEGYLDLCQICGGFGADNENKVVTGKPRSS